MVSRSVKEEQMIDFAFWVLSRDPGLYMQFLREEVFVDNDFFGATRKL